MNLKKILKTIYFILCTVSFNFSIYSETKAISDTQKEYVKNLTITKDNINELPSNLESKIFYNIDVFLETSDADYCEIRTLDEKNKSLVYEIIPENNGHFTRYLTDVCWDCSHFKDGVRDDFYTTDYLFNKPVFFISSHFPMFKELQLLKPAINKDFVGYYMYPKQQQ